MRNKNILLISGLVIVGLGWFLISSLSSVNENHSLPLDSQALNTSQTGVAPKRDLSNLKIIKVTPQQQQAEVTGTAPVTVSNKYTLKSLDNDVVEIGTERHSPPKPYLKLSKWDGEATLKVTVPFNTGDNPEEKGNKLIYRGDKQSVEFYTHVPEEITEKDSQGKEQKFTINEDGGVEFDTILTEKPASNSISYPIEAEGLDFSYQPPLNEENKDPSLTCTQTTCIDKDKNVVGFRPERVVGSYAVYYKDGKSGDYSQVGGKNYKAGKAFHIYRPKIWDASGDTTWGILDLNETSKTLTITVDQEWLSNAVYPVTIDPDFGWQTIGGSWSTYSTELVRGTGFLFTEGGTINSITFYGNGSPSTVNMQAGIYDNSTPHNLLGSSSSISINITTAWKILNVSATFSAGWIYLMHNASGGRTLYYDLSQSNVKNMFPSMTFGTWTNPLTTTVNNAPTMRFSIYATYTAAESGAIPVTNFSNVYMQEVHVGL